MMPENLGNSIFLYLKEFVLGELDLLPVAEGAVLEPPTSSSV